MGWKTDEIIKDLMESEDFYATEIVQVKYPSLYKGLSVIVGDAGYAPGLVLATIETVGFGGPIGFLVKLLAIQSIWVNRLNQLQLKQFNY